MTRTIFLLILLNISFGDLIGQTRTIDSLWSLYHNYSKFDSHTVDIINEIAEQFVLINSDSADVLAKEAYEESDQLSYNRGLGKALEIRGKVQHDYGNYEKAEEFFKQSLSKYKKAN